MKAKFLAIAIVIPIASGFTPTSAFSRGSVASQEGRHAIPSAAHSRPQVHCPRRKHSHASRNVTRPTRPDNQNRAPRAPTWLGDGKSGPARQAGTNRGARFSTSVDRQGGAKAVRTSTMALCQGKSRLEYRTQSWVS
jgi:hypothetical protein